AAQWAKELGLQLIIYDPLTWYWPRVPHIVTQADLYIAQNFFGVSQRISNEPENFPESIIVSPLVPYRTKEKIKKTHDSILVNMGGLSNPFISDDDLIIFAKMVLSSVHEVFESQFDTIDCATSRTIAN